jgi:hypothetical protein
MNYNLLEKLKDKRRWVSLIMVIYSIPIIFGFYYIARYAVDIPFMDQWDSIVPCAIEWYEGNFDLNRLLEVQNDSRPVISNVLMLLISILTSLNVKIMCYVGYTIYLVGFIVLLYFVKTDMDLDYPTLILLIPMSFYAFNPYYLFRFIQNLGAFTGPIMILSALLTIYLLSKSKNSYSFFFISVGMGIICTFNAASGLTIWFAGLVQLLLQKMDKKLQKIILWIISASGTFYVYFILLGFEKEGTHSTGAYNFFLITFLHYPLQKLLCFMGVIGAEVIHDNQVALFFGLIIFFIAVILIYTNRKFLELDKLSKWYGMLTFGILTSLELALTRSGSESLSVFGPPDTIFYIPAPRHSIVIFLPILCIYILAIIYTKNSSKEHSNRKLYNFSEFVAERKHLNLFLLGVISTLLLLSIVLHIMPGIMLGELNYNQQIINRYVLQNRAIAQDYTLEALYPNADIVRSEGAKLEKYNLSIFANSDLNSNLIKDWNSLILVRGGIMAIDRVDNKAYFNNNKTTNICRKTNLSIQIYGWAADNLNKDGNVKAYIVFKNKEDEIIFPTLKIARQDVADSLGVGSYKDSGWIAIVPTHDFKAESYNISLRILRTNKAEYFELNGDKPIYFS